MTTQSIEYINQRRYSRYPFVDTATLTADNGVCIPCDFIVDAMLYPMDLANGLYLSEVDYGNKRIKFADTRTGKVHCVGVWDVDEDTVYLYDSDANVRMVGIVVMGDTRNATSVGGILKFPPVATTLTPAAYISLNQPGVRGITLETGALLTGDIKFEGRGGVVIDTYEDVDGKSIIEISVQGTPEPVEPCYECDLVRSIRVTGSCSMLVADRYRDNTIALTTPFDLADICGATNINLPSKKGPQGLPSQRYDPCAEEHVETEPIDCVTSPSFSIVPKKGRVYIVAPSAGGYDNPISVTAKEDPAAPPNVNSIARDQSLSAAEKENLLNNMSDTSKLTRGKITLGYKGRTPGGSV